MNLLTDVHSSTDAKQTEMAFYFIFLLNSPLVTAKSLLPAHVEKVGVSRMHVFIIVLFCGLFAVSII